MQPQQKQYSSANNSPNSSVDRRVSLNLWIIDQSCSFLYFKNSRGTSQLSSATRERLWALSNGQSCSNNSSSPGPTNRSRRLSGNHYTIYTEGNDYREATPLTGPESLPPSAGYNNTHYHKLEGNLPTQHQVDYLEAVSMCVHQVKGLHVKLPRVIKLELLPE